MQNTLTSEQKRALQQQLKEAVSKEYAKKKKGLGGRQVEYLGSDTVRQVLNEIVPGAWSFEVVERFREEMYVKPDKNVNAYEFSGYCFHVHARLTIDGLGTRDQFGAKVGVGNRDVDANAYKAASSSALVKCAALFDIGLDIYTPENEQYKGKQQEQQWPQQPQEGQWDQQQMNNNVVQMPQQGFAQQPMQDPFQQQQQYVQNGQGQAPFFPEPQQLTQQQFVAPEQQWPQQDMQYFVDPNQGQQPQQMHYNQQVPFPEQMATQGFPQPQGFPEPQQGVVAPPATQEQRDALPEAFWNPAENLMQTQTSAHVELPFENVPPKEEEKKGVFDEKYMSKEAPSLIGEFTQHRQRLGLMEDNSLNPVLRDYFKDANATITSVTNDTIAGLVAHLRTLDGVAG